MAAGSLRRLGPALLVVPALVFVVLVLVVPLGLMLGSAIDNRAVARALPKTQAALATWDGADVPPEAAFAALAADLSVLQERTETASLGRRLNYELPGFSTLIRHGGAAASTLSPPYKPAFLALDARWGDLSPWQVIRRNGSSLTPHFLLTAVDLRRAPDGGIERTALEMRIFLDHLFRTFWLAFIVTAICLLLAYPLAYFMASLPARSRGIVLLFVLFPFWTSMIVRTAAWFILLQRNGPVNTSLIGLGLIDTPLEMIFTRFAVYVGMVHLMLPFMVLPLLSSMLAIHPGQVKAAATLGASPSLAFLRVYLPQTVPGIGAGCVLVFIQTLGFYVTPLLLGGGGDQMLSALIAYFANVQVNFPQAAALALLLLVSVAVIFLLARWLRLPLGGVAVR